MSVTLKIAGKSFRCDCGCNVFTEFTPNCYRCNGCRAEYAADEAVPEGGVSQPSDDDRVTLRRWLEGETVPLERLARAAQSVTAWARQAPVEQEEGGTCPPGRAVTRPAVSDADAEEDEPHDHSDPTCVEAGAFDVPFHEGTCRVCHPADKGATTHVLASLKPPRRQFIRPWF